MSSIRRLTGFEILDSRGWPTVQATCRLASGAEGTASVPSGASTGIAEAVELRDGDPARYAGRGCRQAAAHISHDLHRALAGRADITQQAELDETLIALDGTPDKSRLGGNALSRRFTGLCPRRRCRATPAAVRLFRVALGPADPRPAHHDHQPVQRRQLMPAGKCRFKTC